MNLQNTEFTFILKINVTNKNTLTYKTLIFYIYENLFLRNYPR